MLQLDGKRALVTGGADGIGLGIARRFAAAGAEVVIADIDADAAKGAAEDLGAAGLKADAVQADVTNRDSIRAMMAAAGPVDILVNNAYRGSGIARIEKKPDDVFENALAMNLWAVKWTMEAAFPHMKAQHWGRVINMASLNGVNAHMGSADYNASKEALRAYTRTAAREWAPFGICCNIICPAAWSASSRRMAAMQPGMIDQINAANPMGRLGDPESDIGGVALFLASDDARYITGNTLFADGGAHINGVAWAPAFED